MKRILILFSLVITLVSCHHKEMAYITDATRDSAQDILDKYTYTILPGDQLYIYVASQTAQSVIPFNQETHFYSVEKSRVETGNSNEMGVITQKERGTNEKVEYIKGTVSGYTVTEKGTINFPVLGEIYVVGITQDSLCRHIERRLTEEGYVLDPQVTTSLMNFRVTVVGEVMNPQQIHAEGTRLTILEALAICGDLTDHGMRNNITIMRSDSGERVFGEIDLTKKEMLESPYYYLHNNDIVYVEPDKKYKRQSDRNDRIPSYISMGVSVWNIIRNCINITRLAGK